MKPIQVHTELSGAVDLIYEHNVDFAELKDRPDRVLQNVVELAEKSHAPFVIAEQA